MGLTAYPEERQREAEPQGETGHQFLVSIQPQAVWQYLALVCAPPTESNEETATSHKPTTDQAKQWVRNLGNILLDTCCVYPLQD